MRSSTPCQRFILNDTNPVSAFAEAIDPLAQVREVAQLCWRTCNSFFDWERDCVLKAKPSAEILDKHRQTLTWLIRMIKLLNTMASDPEFPEPDIANDFQILLDRLNHSWQLVHEPGISEEEADKLLQECFPNESGT
ncbi:MAG: hypothetical protein C5B50_29390 [Verrucomicrobia bacterium]|nr:MAG: hypothetical protein C5B50_29390 [Verrucomicrobiota bacterium]